MTASNDSLNSAFTDSSTADADEKPEKEVDPEFEADPSSPQEDLDPAALEEPSATESSRTNAAAVDEVGVQMSGKDDLPTATQTSVENDDRSVQESSSKNSPGDVATNSDDVVDSDLQSSCVPMSVDALVKDDVTEPDKVDSVEVMDNGYCDPDSSVEVRSPDDESGRSLDMDKPTSGEDLIVEDRGDDIDHDSAGRRLSQREDSGIINAEVQTVGSSGDQPGLSSSSSDGEVVMLHQAQVIVHASADENLTDKGVTAGQSISGGRRRASTDSTDRSVYFVILFVVEF